MNMYYDNKSKFFIANNPRLNTLKLIVIVLDKQLSTIKLPHHTLNLRNKQHKSLARLLVQLDFILCITS